MKTCFSLLLACALAVLAFAQEGSTKQATPPPAKGTAQAPASSSTIPASAAVVTAPFALKDDAISQPDRTEVDDGGKAVFKFTVDKAGDYVIHAVVNCPAEDTNSFFVNIDAQPEDPAMIWDIVETTKGFEERIVSWRGNGDYDKNEFSPKRFTLSAGEHKLIIVGREAGQLKSVSIRPVAK